MTPAVLEQIPPSHLAHTVRFRVPGKVRTGNRARSKPDGGKPHTKPEDTLSRLDIVQAYERACVLDGGPSGPWTAGPVWCYLEAVHPKPAAWWPGKACYCKPDLDNVCKLVWDALTLIAWPDDRRIVYGPPAKSFGDRPGLEVTIRFYREVEKPRKHTRRTP